jgi:type II secretion system protein D
VVSLADSLNHRLQIRQASGLLRILAALVVALAGSYGAAMAQDAPTDSSTPSGPVGAAPLTPVTPGTFNYQNAQVTSVLDLYEQLSGMHLIRDAMLTGVPPISLNATGLTKPEMLKLIKAVLMLNGVAILPVDDRTEKVVSVGTNKNPRSESPPVISRVSDLPRDDSVVTYYMPLDYINPQEAVGIFTQTAPVHTYGAYVPAPSAQGVILTEEASVIRELVALKDLIDVPPAKVTTEFVQLNRADSDKVADILNKLLGVGPNGAPVSPAGQTGPVSVRPEIGNNAPMSNEKNLISGPATIISDPRSNRIVITTRPVNMPFLEQMITQLDQPDIFMVPQRRELRFVTAADILPALESALAEGKDEEDQAKKDQQVAQTQGSRPGTTGAGGTPAPASSGGSSSGGSSSVSAITPQLTAPTENDVPTVLSIGNTRLMADNHSNSIIVFGSPDVVGRVFDMIDQLDRKPLQVYLRTVIGELTLTQDLNFGVDLLQKFQTGKHLGLASSNLNSNAVGIGNNTFPNPTTLTTPAAFSALSSGLTLYGAIGSTLDAYVTALEDTDRFKIISTPSVYTSNNKLAVIANGSQVPVPSSITSGFTTSSTDLTTTASVAYEDVLLQLDIIPLINAEHEVTLQIRQTNNTLGANVDISGNEVPIINTQEINTEITVADKSTIVIGGLISDKTDRTAAGLPWLSDIPVLGYLFGAVSKTKERDELIIMIQPTVVATDADQIAVNEAEKQRTILGREAVEAATGVPAAQQSALVPVSPFATETSETTTTTQTAPFNSKGIHYSGGASSTTTTTVQRIPTQQMTPVGPTSPTGPVPALSTPAPDVQNGRMPTVNPPTGPSPPPATP